MKRLTHCHVSFSENFGVRQNDASLSPCHKFLTIFPLPALWPFFPAPKCIAQRTRRRGLEQTEGKIAAAKKESNAISLRGHRCYEEYKVLNRSNTGRF